jgi:signal peptide peptidase SppA
MDLPNLWAITSAALNDIATSARRSDNDVSKVALRQTMLAKQAAAGRGTTRAKGRGVLGYVPILGAISHRGGWWGNTSSMEIVAAVEDMSRDPKVAAIILDIDSPGGTVAGTQEAADAIYAARDRKPIIAIANSLAASAAYWIGSSATKFYAAPSAEVGSIGVYAMHLDISKANDRLGIKPTYISAGKYKVEGNPDAPLTSEAKATIQRSVDAAYADFVWAVARNRGVKLSEVKGGFGEGRVVGAKEAHRLGMVDGVRALASVINIAKNLGVDRPGKASYALRARWAKLKTKR